VGCAGNAHEPRFGAGVDHPFADPLGGLGNGLLQLAGEGRRGEHQGDHDGQDGKQTNDQQTILPHEDLLKKNKNEFTLTA
jgi:hypothetical protein